MPIDDFYKQLVDAGTMSILQWVAVWLASGIGSIQMVIEILNPPETSNPYGAIYLLIYFILIVLMAVAVYNILHVMNLQNDWINNLSDETEKRIFYDSRSGITTFILGKQRSFTKLEYVITIGHFLVLFCFGIFLLNKLFILSIFISSLSLSMFLTQEWGIFYALISALIVSIIGGKALYDWVYNKSEPKIDVYMLKNPVLSELGGEEKLKNMKIPFKRKIIIYFGVQALDNRSYIKPNFVVRFPQGFEVDFSAPYKDLCFGAGKIPIKARPTEIQFVSERSPLRKGQMDYISFPVTFTTPEKLDVYYLETEFSSESVTGPSKKNKLTLEVCDKDYSQNEKNFEYKTFL